MITLSPKNIQQRLWAMKKQKEKKKREGKE
jgi:hypothetical protein